MVSVNGLYRMKYRLFGTSTLCVCVVWAPAGNTAASVAPTSPSVALLDILIIKHLPKVMGNPNGKKLFLLLCYSFSC